MSESPQMKAIEKERCRSLQYGWGRTKLTRLCRMSTICGSNQELQVGALLDEEEKEQKRSKSLVFWNHGSKCKMILRRSTFKIERCLCSKCLSMCILIWGLFKASLLCVVFQCIWFHGGWRLHREHWYYSEESRADESSLGSSRSRTSRIVVTSISTVCHYFWVQRVQTLGTLPFTSSRTCS